MSTRPTPTLDAEARDKLATRTARGNDLLKLAWGRPVEGDDRESAAKDAISDILTALLGPAGTISYGGTVALNDWNVNEASRILYWAQESYHGDAEDYARVPEPGEYGHDEV